MAARNRKNGAIVEEKGQPSPETFSRDSLLSLPPLALILSKEVEVGG